MLKYIKQIKKKYIKNWAATSDSLFMKGKLNFKRIKEYLKNIVIYLNVFLSSISIVFFVKNYNCYSFSFFNLKKEEILVLYIIIIIVYIFLLLLKNVLNENKVFTFFMKSYTFILNLGLSLVGIKFFMCELFTRDIVIKNLFFEIRRLYSKDEYLTYAIENFDIDILQNKYNLTIENIYDCVNPTSMEQWKSEYANQLKGLQELFEMLEQYELELYKSIESLNQTINLNNENMINLSLFPKAAPAAWSDQLLFFGGYCLFVVLFLTILQKFEKSVIVYGRKELTYYDYWLIFCKEFRDYLEENKDQLNFMFIKRCVGGFIVGALLKKVNVDYHQKFAAHREKTRQMQEIFAQKKKELENMEEKIKNGENDKEIVDLDLAEIIAQKHQILANQRYYNLQYLFECGLAFIFEGGSNLLIAYHIIFSLIL